VGFNNPDIPWGELEAVLSGRAGHRATVVDPLAATANGNDSPAWSRKRHAPVAR